MHASLGELQLFGPSEKLLVLAGLFFFALTDLGLICHLFPSWAAGTQQSITDLITLYEELGGNLTMATAMRTKRATEVTDSDGKGRKQSRDWAGLFTACAGKSQQRGAAHEMQHRVRQESLLQAQILIHFSIIIRIAHHQISEAPIPPCPLHTHCSSCVNILYTTPPTHTHTLIFIVDAHECAVLKAASRI